MNGATNSAYSGTVKSYNATKGWGFVQSPETDQMYNGEGIFLLRTELKNSPGCWKGDRVQFRVVQGPKGPQAKDVQLTGSSEDPDKCYFGTVSGLGAQAKYGFIDCPLAKAEYGKDVFVSSNMLQSGPVPNGTQVQFKINQGDKGPQAHEVKVLFIAKPKESNGGAFNNGSAFNNGATFNNGGSNGRHHVVNATGPIVPMVPRTSQSSYRAAPVAHNGGYGQRPAPYTAPPPPPPQAWSQPQHQAVVGWGANQQQAVANSKAPNETTVYFGVLKQVNAEKGWGNIECEALHKIYKKDMFVMKTGLEGTGLFAGQHVQFNVKQGPKGPYAFNLAAMNDMQMASQTFTGTVRSFNDTKGFGFITSDQSHELYQQDIFLAKRELNNVSPSVGDQVHFGVDISSGRPVAKDVLLIGSGFGAMKAEPGTDNRSVPY